MEDLLIRVLSLTMFQTPNNVDFDMIDCSESPKKAPYQVNMWMEGLGCPKIVIHYHLHARAPLNIQLRRRPVQRAFQYGPAILV